VSVSAETASSQPLIVRGAWVLTLEHGDGALADAAIAISADGSIEAVGLFEELHYRWPEAAIAGDGHGIVMPGLVNAHTHMHEGLIAGMAETASLWEWCQRLVHPVEQVITREDVRIGARLRCAEMLLGGVTCVSDMSCHRNLGSLASLGSADGISELGLRGVVAFGAQDHYPQAPAPEIFMAEHEALCDRLAGEELIGFLCGVGTILGVTDELLTLTVAACETHGWGVHTHLAEVREEVTAARLRYRGRNTVEHAAAVRLLDRPVLAGHCIWCGRRDISLLAASEVAVAHNPVANMILASGVCPVGTLQREGITVALGTDGAASNDNLDMLAVMKAAALLQKVNALRADAITAKEVVRMATLDGARALGLADLVGSLEPGKRADVLLLDGNTPELAAIHDPWQQVVYSATGRCVSSVWVDGRERVRDGRLTEVEMRDLTGEARVLARDLAVRAGLSEESAYARGSAFGAPEPERL
jgi:cytosine/adenosine deaminase-related metal-dependent hydrolase